MLGHVHDEIGLLKRHYMHSISHPPEPDQKFYDIVRKLADNKSDETFLNVVMDGLNRTYHHEGDWRKSNFVGAKLLEYDPYLSFIAIEVPLMFFSGVDGVAYDRGEFKPDSPFYGMNVALVSKAGHIGHEKKHIFYDEHSVSRRNIASLYNERYRLKGHMAGLKEDAEEYIKYLCMERETYLLNEIVAHGFYIGSETVRNYANGCARLVADDMYETDILPDGFITSRHEAKEIAEKALTEYFEGVFAAGSNAFDNLEIELGFGSKEKQKLFRIVTSCGPTLKEISSGTYMRPVEELMSWYKHRKELVHWLRKYEDSLDANFEKVVTQHNVRF